MAICLFSAICLGFFLPPCLPPCLPPTDAAVLAFGVYSQIREDRGRVELRRGRGRCGRAALAAPKEAEHHEEQHERAPVDA